MRLDVAYLLDIQVAAKDALEYAQGVDLKQFINDRRLRRAIVNCLHEIGEAAGKLSKKFKEEHPLIPWKQLIVHRNELAHVYFRIDYAESWEIVQTVLPGLLEYIAPLIPPENP